MTLAELVEEALGDLLLNAPRWLGRAGAEVRGVAQASDRVASGTIFVARRGARVDGHRFARIAVDRGAVAVVGERGGIDVLPWRRTPYIAVTDARRAVARLAAALHGYPSQRLRVVGVTGTDGKTTTSVLLHHLLDGDGRAGLLSTALVRAGGEELPLEGRFTTPEAPEVQALLARFVAAGLERAVVESSSHGLAQRRLDEVAYDLAVVTTFTPEHLDFHGSVGEYLEAKRLLVRRAPVAVLNRDSDAFEDFATVVGSSLGAGGGRVVAYGEHPEADWRAERIRSRATGVAFDLVAPGRGPVAVELPLPGRYNVGNALAAIAAAAELGVSPEVAAARLRAAPAVPGRMQIVQREPFAVVVDFAHTAPALGTALAALREGVAGRLIVVIGAAGERDPSKRAPLGAAAVTGADLAIFTEEDHRSESLDAILAAMAAGAERAGGREDVDFVRVPDRRAAIRRALAEARAGDAVLLAGKGHEATLERSDASLPWNEAAEARAALAELERG